jgi:hypothetical protein
MSPRFKASRAELVLHDAARKLVQNDHGVRVEDYLCVLAAATGEAAIVTSGTLDIEDSKLTPGAAVFGDAINQRLTGDEVDLGTVPAATIVGVLRDRLVPAVAPAEAFGDLESRYDFVAAHVGQSKWGWVAVSVEAGHTPWMMPIRAAFEVRPAVAAVESLLTGPGGTPAIPRDLVCAGALAAAIEETAGVLDPAVGVPLSLDIVFGMAKMAPMSRTELADAAGEIASRN